MNFLQNILTATPWGYSTASSALDKTFDLQKHNISTIIKHRSSHNSYTHKADPCLELVHILRDKSHSDIMFDLTSYNINNGSNSVKYALERIKYLLSFMHDNSGKLLITSECDHLDILFNIVSKIHKLYSDIGLIIRENLPNSFYFIQQCLRKNISVVLLIDKDSSNPKKIYKQLSKIMQYSKHNIDLMFLDSLPSQQIIDLAIDNPNKINFIVPFDKCHFAIRCLNKNIITRVVVEFGEKFKQKRLDIFQKMKR
tara:strand:+ start:3299 stop:4063 length:765 start_codon:yes stop_codon:yes gene_type:complete